MKITRLGGIGLGVVLSLAFLQLAACDEESPAGVRVSVEGRGARSETRGARSEVSADVDDTAFILSDAVHWIQVDKCNPTAGNCDVTEEYDGACSFDASTTTSWVTAMGAADQSDGFDDALRGAPAITGPAVYGELPANAGWQSPAAPLEEGARYAINVYVYESCDTEDHACLRVKSAGCQFFTIQGGVVVTQQPLVRHTSPDLDE